MTSGCTYENRLLYGFSTESACCARHRRMTRFSSSRLTLTRSLSRSTGGSAWFSDVSDRGEEGGRTHQDPVRAERDHRRRRRALERHEGDQFPAVLAQQAHHAQRHLAAAAVGLDEQVDRVVLAEPLEDLVQREHVVRADRSARVVPVRDQRPAQQVRHLLDHRLVLTNSTGGCLILGLSLGSVSFMRPGPWKRRHAAGRRPAAVLRKAPPRRRSLRFSARAPSRDNQASKEELLAKDAAPNRQAGSCRRRQRGNLPRSTARRASRNAAAFQLWPAMPIGLSVRP